MLAGENENFMLNAEISALAGKDAPLALLALLFSLRKAARYQREHRMLLHFVTVIFPPRE